MLGFHMHEPVVGHVAEIPAHEKSEPCQHKYKLLAHSTGELLALAGLSHEARPELEPRFAEQGMQQDLQQATSSTILFAVAGCCCWCVDVASLVCKVLQCSGVCLKVGKVRAAPRR